MVCNGVKEWVTDWNPALMASYVRFPVTHYMRYKRPYPRTAEDRTHVAHRDVYNRLIEKK